MNIKKSIRSFRPAFKGIYETILEGNNMKIQIIAGIVAIAISLLLHISKIEFIIILICIGLVWSAELFNTALELIVDKITKEQEEWARKTKDASAGAVLILALMALVIGIIIWLPYLILYVDLLRLSLAFFMLNY
jgi:diacylglycerol kinase (ATP)